MAKDDAWQAARGSKTERRAVERDGMNKNQRCRQETRPDGRRRALLGGLTGWIFSPMLFRPGAASAADGDDPRKMRAQPGDQLVFKTGERQDETISMADVAYGAKPLVAYPYDPVDGVLRRGSRLNQILVVRLAEDGYTDEVRARAVDGVIAYSAICSHMNCPVTGWHPDDQLFICPCHRRRQEGGFTLIEVMIAMIIMGVGLLAMALAQMSAMRMSTTSKQMSHAMNLAEQQIEAFYVSPPLAAGTFQDPANPIPADLSGDDLSTFNRSWLVQTDTPSAGLSTVTVTVVWNNGMGGPGDTGVQSRTVNLRGIVRP